MSHVDRYSKGVLLSTVALVISAPLILAFVGLSGRDYRLGLLAAEAVILLTAFVSVGVGTISSRRAGPESADLERTRFRLAIVYLLLSMVLVAGTVVSYLSRG